MIVVFDTNVLIPMILDVSRSTRILRRLRAVGHRVGTTQAILEEVEDKLRTKRSLRKWLDTADDEIDNFVTELPKLCDVFAGMANAHGSVPADPDDDKIIAAAIEAKADYIVSEDKHLLDLGEHEGIPIMNREQFAAELDRLGVPGVE